jgi:hypothetical protein
MKTKERMAAFERFIMAALSNLECQRRRIDELAARVAELEPMAREARRQAVRFAGRGNEIEDRQEATEAALFRAQERIAELESFVETLQGLHAETQRQVNELKAARLEPEPVHKMSYSVAVPHDATVRCHDHEFVSVATDPVCVTGEREPQFAATYDDLETPQEPQDLGARQCPECGREFGRVRRATP